VLSFISTITTFAGATDITVAELSIESFYPTDPATVDALRTFRCHAGCSQEQGGRGQRRMGVSSSFLALIAKVSL
jgi:hypothetical protein